MNSSSGEWGWFISGTWGTHMSQLQTEQGDLNKIVTSVNVKTF
jgi:hypothetical protein